MRALELNRRGLVMTVYALGVAACLALAGCSGGGNNDKVRIGSGQSGNGGSTNATDYPVFYVKRATPDMTNANTDDDIRHVRPFIGNADLYMRDRASPSAAEHNITARVRQVSTEVWDVKDVDVSADGSKVIFAMRGPIGANQNEDDPPNWGIWEYVIASDDLHQIVETTDDGLSQYVSPHYLPDGHILFASTRQTQSKAILISEGKPQFDAQNESRNRNDGPIFNLHVMDGSGGGIQQITFNQSHDLSPTVMADGRILYSRWDNAPGRTGGGGIHLYSVNPDGTGGELLYGSMSHNTVADNDPTTNTTAYPDVHFTQAHEMLDGNVMVLVRPFNDTEFGGDLYIVNTKDYVENTQAANAGSGMAGPAQTKATPNSVRLVNAPSPGGRYAAAVPLWDGSNRILVSWTQCRVLDASNNSTVVPCTDSRLSDPATRAAQPIYSLWMYSPNDQTLQPVVAPVDNIMITDVAVAQPRTAPQFRAVNLSGNVNLDSALRTQGVGVLDIRSVYDFDGTVGGGITNIGLVADPTNPAYANRRARFLRLEKAVSLPDQDTRDIDNSAFGATNFMREILGYVPIEPDGSVKVKVPANVAFQISVVDQNGRRVSNFPRHNAWLTLRPGETVQCTGCHTPSTNLQPGQSGVSHGRAGAFASAYSGASNAGSVFANTNSTFPAINVGDTMAQARATWSCANEQCASITPSVNVAYADVWPAMNGSWDFTACPTITAAAYSMTESTCRTMGDFKFVYTGGNGVPKIPTATACLTAWSNTCRITINYLEHIQPIWERAHTTDINGDMVVDAKDTCTSCHSRTDAAGATQVPAAQLELTSDASHQNNAGVRVNSYEELLSGDRQQQLVGMALQDICLVPAIDPNTGLVTGCTTFATVPPSLAARNAAGSRFFAVFSTNQCRHVDGTTGACTIDHRGWLTAGELRLLSEWVDIGAQYYNDPFKAPVN